MIAFQRASPSLKKYPPVQLVKRAWQPEALLTRQAALEGAAELVAVQPKLHRMVPEAESVVQMGDLLGHS